MATQTLNGHSIPKRWRDANYYINCSVDVQVKGFKGRKAVAEAVATTEGFAIVLCDLKSLLETGKSGGMVRDKAVLIAAASKE